MRLFHLYMVVRHVMKVYRRTNLDSINQPTILLRSQRLRSSDLGGSVCLLSGFRLLIHLVFSYPSGPTISPKYSDAVLELFRPRNSTTCIPQALL